LEVLLDLAEKSYENKIDKNDIQIKETVE
jgi:hypothetical protein